MFHAVSAHTIPDECPTQTELDPRDLLITEKYGVTPLMRALRSQDGPAETKAVMSLILRGARNNELSGEEVESIVTARTSIGLTPLHLLGNAQAPAKLRAFADGIRDLAKEKYLPPTFLQTTLMSERRAAPTRYSGREPAFGLSTLAHNAAVLPELLNILSDILNRGELSPKQIAPLLFGHPDERPGELLDALMTTGRDSVHHLLDGMQHALSHHLLTGSELAAALSPCRGPSPRPGDPDCDVDPLRRALHYRGDWLATPLTKLMADALRERHMTRDDVMRVLERSTEEGGPLVEHLAGAYYGATREQARRDYLSGLDLLFQAGLPATDRQRLLPAPH